MDISATDRNPEPGDNPLLFSTDSKGSFRCTQPQTVMHTTKPLLNQLYTTGICPHHSNQHTQDSNPGPSDHESQTLCVSPPSEDVVMLRRNMPTRIHVKFFDESVGSSIRQSLSVTMVTSVPLEPISAIFHGLHECFTANSTANNVIMGLYNSQGTRVDMVPTGNPFKNSPSFPDFPWYWNTI